MSHHTLVASVPPTKENSDPECREKKTLKFTDSNDFEFLLACPKLRL